MGADLIRFTPRFPLIKGLPYSARVDRDILFILIERTGAGMSRNLEATFTLPKSDLVASTVVTQIYPTADELPENQLKFYLHFSAPMKRGQAYQRIHLLDASGRQVDVPFLELTPELWDLKTQRLTLLFDPGRIKRGLRPHEDLGMALQKGRAYRLVIDRHMLDARGQDLPQTFEKHFTVVAADRMAPNYTRWSLTTPTVNTYAPVTVNFPEPLDHGLLGHLFAVQDSVGNDVPGDIEIMRNETMWAFVPSNTWETGEYTILIDTRIEDLAGNTLNYLFDVDIQQEGNLSPDQTPFVKLHFKVTVP